VRYLFGAYDVHSDRLHGRLRAHKNAGEVLAFYRQIRMRYDPRLRIHLVADNLSTHKTPAIHEWAEASNVELVFTPTYASFLNRIECHFWAIGEFVVKNADYPDWDTLAKAMAEHITYRNGPHRDQRPESGWSADETVHLGGGRIGCAGDRGAGRRGERRSAAVVPRPAVGGLPALGGWLAGFPGYAVPAALVGPGPTSPRAQTVIGSAANGGTTVVVSNGPVTRSPLPDCDGARSDRAQS
jgi:transposase